LNRAADKSLKVLVQAAEADSSVMVAVLPHLVGGHGTYNFDTATKTKTIEKLLGCVDDDNASSVIDILLKPVTSVVGYVPKLFQLMGTRRLTHIIVPMLQSRPICVDSYLATTC
jgi:hypothetical protein